MKPISISEQIAEVKRELNLRARLYPRFIQSGRMAQGEADQHTETLQAVLSTLEMVQAERMPELDLTEAKK